jgi:hypothetical protein
MSANRAALRRLWATHRKARAGLKLAQDAQDYWVLDRARRSLKKVLNLPGVCIYVVQPGAVWETMLDPWIKATFELGQPTVFAFMRREDAIDMRDHGRRTKLAATPTDRNGRRTGPRRLAEPARDRANRYAYGPRRRNSYGPASDARPKRHPVWHASLRAEHAGKTRPDPTLAGAAGPVIE